MSSLLFLHKASRALSHANSAGLSCAAQYEHGENAAAAGALLPHLGTQAHGCLADAVEAFPNRPFVSPAHLHRFHQVGVPLLSGDAPGCPADDCTGLAAALHADG